MLERLHNSIVGTMDVLLGWLLRFPSDAQLFAVAVGSAIILTAVRFWTSDQDLLRRCRYDKDRLKVLIREAKGRKDAAAVKRHRTTIGMIAMKQFRQEARPLVVSLLPIALLATWAFNRLEFHPLAASQSVEFAAYFPISAVGKIAHITPSDGLSAETGWIQEIVAVSDQRPTHGIATWRLTAEARAEPYRIHARFDKNTFDHSVRIGFATYEPPLKKHDDHLLATEVKMKPVKLFGVIPGIPAMLFPPWLVAYLLIVIPSVAIIRKAFKIC